MSALAAEPLRVEKHLPAPHKFARALVKRAPVLCLPFAERCRSRLRASLSDGREVALFLARGTVLRGGDLLVAEDGSLIRIESKAQTLLEARSRDPLALARGSYHLGNRHIRVEIGEAYIRLEADPVLKDMLEGLGLAVGLVELPFEPEPGAYGGGHKHGHEESFAEDYALAQAAFVEHGGSPAAARDGLGELLTQPATYRQAAGQGGRHGASRAHQHTHEHAHQHPHEHGHAHGHAHGHDHAHHPAEEHAHGHDHGSHGESPAGTPQPETAQPGTAHRGRPAEEDAHHPLGGLMAHGSHAHPAPEGTGARLAAHGASQASGD